MIGGCAFIDLTDVPPERMVRRLNGVCAMPAGARAIVVVGASAVEPAVIDALRDFAGHVSVTIAGEPWNVERWLGAMGATEGAIM